ncbi:substrate-binding domain-containing protein, partial [Pseudomonas syringae pv. tagetis]|uniref:substrate-binding domain-containing protein n=1 Tax=Pseudomonas syringae group genomosp. 7 TaxID=251699 RepID=UPI00377027F4
ERRDGYVATLEGLGIKPWLFVPDTGRAPFEAGKHAMDTLMSQPARPDAIFFDNDKLAAGALLASQRAGLHIPKQSALM